MQTKLLTAVILTLIILFGAYLRFANLEDNPNGLYVDEASTVVNAWSILETGKDEYGKSYPLAFRFLGSFTPPLYTYLTSAVIYLNGLSITSVRLISAISGVTLVVVFYFLIISLKFIKSPLTAIFATALFAIAPWAIFYSRIGYEINLAFLLYSLGVLFLWLGIKNSINLIFGLVFLSLSTNAYHSERLLSHITVLCFFILFRKILLIRKNVKVLTVGFLLYILMLLPQILIFFTPANTSRGLGLFYSGELTRQINDLSFLPVFLSAPIAFVREFMSLYLTYFSPRSLFFQGDSDLQRSLPELSVFYPWMAFFYFIGLLSLIKTYKTVSSKFIFLLLIITPIPAALTGDPFSTQRVLPLLLPLMVTITFGLDRFLKWNTKISATVILIFFTLSLLYLYRSAAVLFPNERAKIWGYGFEELSEEIKKNPNKKFLIDTGRIKPAYIELTYYLKIPPESLQAAIDPNLKTRYYFDTNWKDHYILDNFETRIINWEEDIFKDQILVGDELAISKQQAKEHFLKQIFEIKSPQGEITFRGFETNPDLKCKSQFTKGKCSL